MEPVVINNSKKHQGEHARPMETVVVEPESGAALVACPCNGHCLLDSHPMSAAQLQSAAFLAIFSCFVLVEGSTRTTIQVANVIRFGAGGNDNLFSPAALLVGALLEVIFGILGMIVAMGVLLYGWVYPRLILATLCIQLLGWYTFIVFAIASPAHVNRRYLGLSDGQSQFVVICGILGAMCYCAILQGGQIFFTWQLWSHHVGNRVYHTVNFYRFWLIVSAVILFIVGCAQWWIGAVVLHEQGTGLYSRRDSVVAMPYAVFYAGLSVFVGLVMTLAALYAMYNAIAFKENIIDNVGKVSGMWTYFAPVMLFVWLVQLTCMGFVQASYGILPALTAMLVGLTFLISAAPVILDSKMRTTFTRQCSQALVETRVHVQKLP